MGREQQIRDYIVENFLLGDGSKLTPTQSLLGTGVLDSTGAMELITFLENTFKIAVDDKEVVPANLDSVANIAAFVERKLSAKGGAAPAAPGA
jgi:acyl carrier protein